MSSYERISDYLRAHPTPWRVEDMKARGELHEAIVDTNGDVVLTSEDAESYQSEFAPDGAVQALVDFVNLVGEDYEPPCGWPGVDYGPIEPVDAGTYRRRLSDADVERLKENMPESFAPEGVKGVLRRLGWRGLG